MTIDALDYGKAPDFSLYENAEKWVSTRPKVLCNSDAGDFPEYLSKNFRWTRTHSAAQLLARLNATHKDVKEVRNIRIVNRTSSGLISRVALDTHPVGTIILNGESEIRRALGLPSSFFTLHRNFETDGHLKHVLIKGAGSGHHVGLCQMGAMRLAQMGHDYIFILKHYYQGIEVYRIYE
jgi:SpoIID/LytB domain protein